MSQSVTTTDEVITIEVDQGCVDCPLAHENSCGCDAEVAPTHTYSYPMACSLLDRTIIIKRKRQHE